MSAWFRIANVFSRRLNDDIDEELRSHIEDARLEGRDPTEAARAFGSPLRARESVRDAVVASWLESISADVFFGGRQLLKHKAASAAAIVSLALGIGSCVAAFRLIDAMLLRPLPVANPERLYVLTYDTSNEHGQAVTGDSFDYPGFRKLRAAVNGQAELMAIADAGRADLTYGSDLEMEKAYQQRVSGWTFQEFGLKPALGRLFTEDDDRAPGASPYAVLSYDYWTRRFGRNPAVLGKTFHSAGLYQIIGVAPPGFTGTDPGTLADFFLPMMTNPKAINEQNWHWFRIWVHVNPGVRPELVEQRLRAALHTHRQEQVKSWTGTPQRAIEQYLAEPVHMEPAAAGVSNLQRMYRRALAILGALVALVLLIAAANVANLMTAQAAARVREMALRVSIGAVRVRLVQLVLIESALLAASASLLGIGFAWWAAPFVVGMINPPDDPARLILPADFRVTSFAILLTFTVAILFGLAPALRASSVKPASALKGGDDPNSRRRLMNMLVAAQVAFCFLVHFVAGMFISTFQKLANQPTGFSSAHVLALETVSERELPQQAWYQTADHLSGLPGVESASAAMWALFSGSGWNGGVWANGHSPGGSEVPPWFLGVSPGWFETMKIPLLDGRDFRPDEAFPEVAAVNATFAREYFDGGSPVGSSFETVQEVNGRITHVTVRIVGYVGDARYTDMRRPIPPTVYVPFRTMVGRVVGRSDSATFLVRTRTGNPLALASMLRQEVHRVRPELRVSNIRTQDELVRRRTLQERMLATLSLFFALVALVLSGVGLCGVLHYTVFARRRELGIRIALGARAGHIASKVTLEIFAMLALGAAAGLALGVASERYIAMLLFQVKATDPAILAAPAITILAAAMLAAVPPVVRAIRIDPAQMLRAE
ncbi:MAG: ABC transporter permease [Bryobacterales bacterium]|nr:ABC transporter permease [Bryobacterales bacterium]MBV9400880.1 ABC transporter permease [Bryobacterales bacterium]